MTAAENPPLLACRDLYKRYNGLAVIDNLSFAYGCGAVALTGRNGAGKSTLISMLAGVEAADAGSIAIAGHDLATQPRRARQALAYVPDESVAYDFMTGSQFLLMVRALRGIEMNGEETDLLQRFGLAPHRDQQFRNMSLGTSKKFMLVAGLLGGASVVFMDEPTNGIDADAKDLLAQLIREQQSRRLFFFSTHDQEFITAAAARVHPL